MNAPLDSSPAVDLELAVVPGCADLFVSVFNAEPWHDGWTVSSAARRLTDMVNTPGFVGVAVLGEDGQVDGAALGHTEQWVSGRHFYLQEMFVRRNQQRRGHGRRLLAELRQRLPDVEVMYLMTDQETPAQSFYEREGFGRAAARIVMTRRDGGNVTR